jgi:hypothetical protein
MLLIYFFPNMFPSPLPTKNTKWFILSSEVHGQIYTTIFYGVPLSHDLITMRNTHNYILRCPTVPPSHCYDKYINCLFWCPTVSLPMQIHTTICSGVPLSHRLTTMTNTHHYIFWCPTVQEPLKRGSYTVPPSHCHDKYTNCIFWCPTVSLPWHIHATI